MGDAREFFTDGGFDPDTVDKLVAAYDLARKSLHDKGQPPVVLEVIAQRIIVLAKDGQRDPRKLADGALAPIIGKDSL